MYILDSLFESFFKVHHGSPVPGLAIQPLCLQALPLSYQSGCKATSPCDRKRSWHGITRKNGRQCEIVYTLSIFYLSICLSVYLSIYLSMYMYMILYIILHIMWYTIYIHIIRGGSVHSEMNWDECNMGLGQTLVNIPKKWREEIRIAMPCIAIWCVGISTDPQCSHWVNRFDPHSQRYPTRKDDEGCLRGIDGNLMASKPGSQAIPKHWPMPPAVNSTLEACRVTPHLGPETPCHR